MLIFTSVCFLLLHYHACVKELKVWSDTNMLWDFPFNDLFQNCRDDILHQIHLGMMQDLIEEIIWHKKDVSFFD